MPDVATDLAAATAIARRYLSAQVTDAAVVRHIRQANRRLLVELLALVAITHAIVYALPWWLAAAVIVPWSIASALLLDNAVHYLNHWPPFRREPANQAWRAAAALLFFNPL